MNEHAEILDSAEQLPATMADAADASLAVGLSRAEIDSQITTARRFPRDLTSVQKRLLSYVTLDEETAEECMYALPRGGKPITGPSVRFAEALKASFGNCRAAARVVHVDRVEKVVIAEGIFHDLETNSASKAEIRRRICDKRGRIYTDDMIIVTGNAACSIALRNAILAGVPKPVWRRAYDAVQRTVAGDVKTLSVTRDKAIKALAAFGVKPEQIFTAIDVVGMDDITVDHIPILRGMFAALKNSESTVEEMFATTIQKAEHKRVENPLSDDEPSQSIQDDLAEVPGMLSVGQAQPGTYFIGKSTGASGDMGGEHTPSEASVVASGQAPDAGTEVEFAKARPPSANDLPVGQWRSGRDPAEQEQGHLETAADTAAQGGGAPPSPPTNPYLGIGVTQNMADMMLEIARTPSGSIEARADGVSPPPVSPPSIFQQYWEAIQEGIRPREVAKISNAFFNKHPLPDDAQIRNKFLRIRTIRENVAAGVYSKEEGEEKALCAIES